MGADQRVDRGEVKPHAAHEGHGVGIGRDRELIQDRGGREPLRLGLVEQVERPLAGAPAGAGGRRDLATPS